MSSRYPPSFPPCLSTPKTGSTWLRSLLSGIYRLPQLYLEPGSDCEDFSRAGIRWVNQYHILPSPELTAWIHDKRAVVITTIRHPGDVLISLYHHLHNFRAKTIDLDAMRQMLSTGFERTGLRTYSTGQPFWADLTCSLQWMAQDRVHVVRYEDLFEDPRAALRQLTGRIWPVPDDRIEDEIDMCDLRLMRAMAGKYSGFFREGRIGSWRDVLSPAIIDVFRTADPYPAQMAALGYTMDPADPMAARQIQPRRRHPMLALERFENGAPTAPIVIKCFFWQAVEQKALWNPQLDSVADSFHAWLNSPCARAGAGICEDLPLSNLAAFIYDQRPDLQLAFPDLTSRDRYRYAQWFLDCAQKEHQLDTAFIEPVRQGLWRWAVAASARPGTGFYDSLPVPNLAAFFYDQRPDLQAAYPDLTSGDRYEYLQWYLRTAQAEYGLGPEFIDPVREAVRRWENAVTPIDGTATAANFILHICRSRADVLGSFSAIHGKERREMVRSVIRAAKALNMDPAYVRPLEKSLGRRWLPEWVRAGLGRLVCLLVAPCLVFAQQPSDGNTKTAAAEVETKGAPVKFTSRVNLVPVTVVVRDSRGNAVGNLTKEDFRLLDNGKPQVITKFSIEKPGAPVVIERQGAEMEARQAKPPGAAAPPVIADHFAAYLFDDVHTKFEDLARTREAAARVLSSMQPAERVAIYTTSGQISQEFTNEQAKLQDTLLRLRPVPVARSAGTGTECPDISYYMADRIVNQSDEQALQVALTQYQACSGNPYVRPSEVMGFAQQALTAGEHETRLATTVLNQVVRRMSAMPGQRSIVLASPGFLVPMFDQPDVTEVINRAIRANVIISTLDARGLWTPPGFEASRPSPPGGAQVTAMMTSYLQMEASAQEDVLAELADGTGGVWFHANNDLGEGLRRLAAAPEYIYVLAFTPENLKSNGKFHSLKVTLKEGKGLTLQARKGYYAPRRETEMADQAKQDIEDALFSREVMKDIPVTLHTQFFKSSEVDAKLSVLARIDVRILRYRKEEGRNRDNLTVVAALFDPNGNFVAGQENKIEMRLRDETLEKKLGSGITIKSSFDVKVGSYAVRVVVRDSEGQLMAAENGAVEIP